VRCPSKDGIHICSLFSTENRRVANAERSFPELSNCVHEIWNKGVNRSCHTSGLERSFRLIAAVVLEELSRCEGAAIVLEELSRCEGAAVVLEDVQERP